jgi:putative heme iron utilization protein
MLRRMTTDAHGRPQDRPLTFSAADVPAPTHAERARTLVAAQATGALGTLALEPAGYPYTSFTTFALASAEPVFLISRIAEHTRNLAGDSRASLLVHEQGNADPLANGRVTLLGRCEKLPRLTQDPRCAEARAAFLARHPSAAYYVDYDDFDFWQLRLEAVRYIGGYGRMSWVDAGAFRAALPDPVAPGAAQIISHMNEDHASALRLYARAYSSAHDAEAATMTAVDRHGFELTVTTPRGVGPARIAFPAPLAGAGDARGALIALLRAAEARLAGG